MGAKSKKDRSVSASTTNYAGSISDAGAARNVGGSNGKDDRLEQLQADHELFLQAFESMNEYFVVQYSKIITLVQPQLYCTGHLILVLIYLMISGLYGDNNIIFPIVTYFSEPTQIYRFLRTRNMINVSLFKIAIFQYIERILPYSIPAYYYITDIKYIYLTAHIPE